MRIDTGPHRPGAARPAPLFPDGIEQAGLRRLAPGRLPGHRRADDEPPAPHTMRPAQKKERDIRENQ
ncbi:hypothetical protein [Pseudorhodoferax sp.]|uniref:hypothetical protein n=1 Tax=Pseudorhodoferax sp. TaxID=1993553 RepID=UPI0039E25E00